MKDFLHIYDYYQNLELVGNRVKLVYENSKKVDILNIIMKNNGYCRMCKSKEFERRFMDNTIRCKNCRADVAKVRMAIIDYKMIEVTSGVKENENINLLGKIKLPEYKCYIQLTDLIADNWIKLYLRSAGMSGITYLETRQYEPLLSMKKQEEIRKIEEIYNIPLI